MCGYVDCACADCESSFFVLQLKSIELAGNDLTVSCIGMVVRAKFRGEVLVVNC